MTKELRGYSASYEGLVGPEKLYVHNMSGSPWIAIECRDEDQEKDGQHGNVLMLPKEQAIELAMFILNEYVGSK